MNIYNMIGGDLISTIDKLGCISFKWVEIHDHLSVEAKEGINDKGKPQNVLMQFDADAPHSRDLPWAGGRLGFSANESDLSISIFAYTDMGEALKADSDVEGLQMSAGQYAKAYAKADKPCEAGKTFEWRISGDTTIVFNGMMGNGHAASGLAFRLIDVFHHAGSVVEPYEIYETGSGSLGNLGEWVEVRGARAEVGLSWYSYVGTQSGSVVQNVSIDGALK